MKLIKAFYLFTRTTLLMTVCIYIGQLNSCPLDLEEGIQDFVLDTQKIEIPDYPNAFNASIIKWRNSIFLSFRIIPNLNHPHDSRIGIVQLDEQFLVINKPQIFEGKNTIEKMEDARLISINEHLYMIYTGKESTSSRFNLYISELDDDDESFSIKDLECLSDFEENQKKDEKNWVPFDYNHELYLAYSLKPHKIFLKILGTPHCATLTSTDGDFSWNLGELRGGTPGLAINEDEYLAFFHSSLPMTTIHSNGINCLHYFIGAYTFSRNPPFHIIRISNEPIIGKGFYGNRVEPYFSLWGRKAKVPFPCGFIFDENNIWVSYGKDRHEIWIVKLDKAKLLESLYHIN